VDNNFFCEIGKSQGKYPILAENTWHNVHNEDGPKVPR